ncbi:PAAR domain-containing protein [Pseudomonas lundensis]|uniref:PAAR domain-containing protein n=1 Tax=Pseudomonas TaxID=286 RepID=UPI00089DCA02|nr:MULTISPECIES: PAAR domain-containing protein [Pseudomonas]NNA10937.1 PAAR domain-containing protein [Pseudomonas lundensis]NNA15447.1 PAAR domain-containing protein [Pseudomonas lundensis]
MALGYFIGLDDKTTCGGKVLESDPGITWSGMQHALEGHLVSCGQDGKAYPICGGVEGFISHGRRVAGTLDSRSGCPCQAELIASVTVHSYVTDSAPAFKGGLTAGPQPMPATFSTTCDERFQLLNQHGLPLRQLGYAVLQNDHCMGYGTLDAQGHTCSCASVSPEPLGIAINAPSPVME